MQRFALIAIVTLFAASAPAQYQAYRLQTIEPSLGATAQSISGGRIAGRTLIEIPGGKGTIVIDAAVLWPTYGSPPLLLDSSNLGSSAHGAFGQMVAGELARRAVYWPNGAADDYVDLHPVNGSGASAVYAIDAGSQGGFSVVQVGDGKGAVMASHPFVWFGSSESAVDLHDGSTVMSHGLVRGVAPGRQVGIQHSPPSKSEPTVHHAFMWSGTPESAVDIHPQWASYSDAMATDGSQHVGSGGLIEDGKTVAILWSADGSTATSLDPPGSYGSEAWGCRNGKQVGYVQTQAWGEQHAFVWSGSAASGIDLHEAVEALGLVGPTFATHIDENGVISGYVWENMSRFVPLVWVPTEGPANTPPIAVAGGNQTLSYAGQTTNVILDGSSSYDPDLGDSITSYGWMEGPVSLGTSAQITVPMTVGDHLVTLTVTDSRGATATDSAVISIHYTWNGFSSPVNPDGSSLFKLGSTVPIKFTLGGLSATAAPTARIYIAKITDGVFGTEFEPETNGPGDSGNEFRYENGQYQFNWSTKGQTVGAYRVRADLGDGNGANAVLISLK